MKKFTLRATALALSLAAAGLAHAGRPSADHPAVQAALAQVRANAAALNAGADDAFAPHDLTVDADGSRHVHFKRSYRGLRVIGGDFVVHSDGNGRLRAVTQTLRGALALDTAPTASDALATQRAIAAFRGRHDDAKAELVVWARGGQVRLAYDVLVSGLTASGMESRQHRILDAHTLKELDAYDDIQTVDTVTSGDSLYVGTVPLHADLRADGTYALVDATRGNHTVYDMKNKGTIQSPNKGDLVTDADGVFGGDAPGKASNSDAVDAAYGQNMTWDYYKTVFQRNGIADDGRGGYSRVHANTGPLGLLYNASWSDACFCMSYSSELNAANPALLGLDVAGHEMTHGVTSNSAGLIYSGESGGLNEGTSDIMGTMVEYFADNPADPPDYLLGEQIGTPLRTMYHPSVDGKSADCWYPDVGKLDVHYSSGVANHVYYLIAEGSQPADGPASPTCLKTDTRVANGKVKLPGIGRDKARAVWYRALTVYMTEDTDYAHARAATLSAAADLYGGVGSTTYKRVANAWKAVRVQ